MTDWISKSAEMRFKLPFEEAIAARLSMEDAERAFYEPFSIAIGGCGGRPASDRRRIPDAVFRIARTGSPWRDPPEEFGALSSVYRRFRRRMPAGLWETTPEALNESGAMPGDRVQTIDCHPCPSFGGGRKGGLENKVLAARKGGFTTRTHLIANARGLPVRAEMTGLRLQRLRCPG